MFLTTAQWIERVKTDMEELTPDWDNVVSQTGGADIDISVQNGQRLSPNNY